MKQTLESYSLRAFGEFGSLSQLRTLLDSKSTNPTSSLSFAQVGEIYDLLLQDVSKATESVTQVLKMYQTLGNTKSRLQERLGKAENDYKNICKKYERAEEKLLEKDKKIGEIENNLLKIRDMNKGPSIKKPTNPTGFCSNVIPTEDNKSKLKAQATLLFDHEIKKKDLEIYKLKDAVKRSIILQKDKAEVPAQSKFSRFEVNNFYDGLEKDFNLLDSRKSVVYKLMVDEGSDLRELVMLLFDDLVNISHHLIQHKDVSARALLNNSSIRAHSPAGVGKLTWETLNQPLSSVKLEVKRSIYERLNELRKTLGMKPLIPST